MGPPGGIPPGGSGSGVTVSTPLYPVLLKLDGRPVAVIGGGRVAARKVAGLLASGARVTVIAPRAVAEVAERAEQGEIDWVVRAVRPEDLDRVELVVAATGDVEVNRQVVAAAHERRLLVNAVDDPERCDFYLPAVIRRGDLVVSVSTSGSSPALARELARELGEGLHPTLDELTQMLAEARAEIQRRFPDDPGLRTRLSEALVRSPARRLLGDGDVDGARRVLMDIAGGPETGTAGGPATGGGK